MKKSIDIAIRYKKLVSSMNSLIDDITKERDYLLKHNKELKKENQQLRRLLASKFKEANKDIELKELDIRV